MHARGSYLSEASELSQPHERLSVCILAYKDLGANTRVARQAATLAAAGHHVAVVSFSEPDLELAPALAQVEFVATGVPSIGGGLSTLLRLPRLLRGRAGDLTMALASSWGMALGQSRCQMFAQKALQATAGKRFDVVQAHFDKALIAAEAVQRQCGGRLAFDAVETPFDFEKLPSPRDMRALRRAEIAREVSIARRADLWLTVGDSLAHEITRRLGIDSPLVIRNCCSQARTRAPGRLRADLGLPPGCRLIISLNSFRPNDGLETVVDALSFLPMDVHLAVLGTPARGADAKMLVSHLSAATRDRLHFPELQRPSQLVDYLSDADMGIVALRPITTNLRVALPNRVFELIAAGLPLAASRIDDISALVTRYGIGQIYDEDDPRAAASAIIDILDHLERYRTATADAALELNWEREGLAYLRAIENLAGNIAPAS
jgi:glycosyltransferase involved in cell wall biosynthesis